MKSGSRYIYQYFYSIIDWFESLDMEGNTGDETNRMRIAIVYVLITAVTGLVFSSLYFWMGSIGAGLAPLLGMPAVGVFLILIKRNASVEFISNFFIIVVAGVLFNISYFTGGFEAPVIVWFIVLPIIAFFTAGPRPGIVWCFLIIVVYFVYYALHKAGFHFRQDLSKSDIEIVRFLALVCLVPLVFSFLQIIDYLNRRTQKLIKSREVEQQRIQKAVDESSDAIGIFSPAGIPFYLNKKFKEVFGLFGKDGGERSGVQSHFANQEISAEIGRMVQAGKSWSGETQVIRKDGKKIQTLSRVDVIRDETEEIIANIRAHTDITQQKEAEDALKVSEERYRFLMENVTDVIWTRDMDLNLTYVSPAIERIRGYSPEEALKQTFENSMTPESQKIVHEVWEKEMSNMDQSSLKEVATEVEIYHKDGSTVWVEIKARLVIDKKGIPVGLTGVTRDVSQRKNAEAKLEAAQKKLIKNAHQAGMAEIAADTLHNVGNLMNSIKTSAHVIQSTTINSSLSELKKANDLFRENFDRVNEFLVNDISGKKLLKYYLILEDKMEAENQQIVENINRLNRKIETVSTVITAQQANAGLGLWEEKCSIAELIEDVLDIQLVFLKNNQVSIYKKFEAVPDVFVQKSKLIHVLINLLQNSVSAMMETPKSNRSVHLVLTRHENVVRLKIEDTGIGIQQEDLIKVFNHGFTTRKDGHGFGLHSCANYMSEMNGKIRAESNGENQGARFYLELPIE